MKPSMPVTAIHRDGRTIVFEGWNDFLRWATKVPFAEKFRDAFTSESYRWLNTPATEWIVRDNNGKPLVKDKIDFSSIETPWQKAYYKMHRHAAQLGLPIPGTAHHCYQKHRATAMKNSGQGARARDWVRAAYDKLMIGDEENTRRLKHPREEH